MNTLFYRTKFEARANNQNYDHQLRFNGSFRSLESMAYILNSTPNTSINVPSTKYKIKQLIPPAIYFEYNIKCSGCGNYLPSRNSQTKCDTCEITVKASDSDYFIYIPIEQQLKQNLDKHFNEIVSYASNISESGYICDIHSGNSKRYPFCCH